MTVTLGTAGNNGAAGWTVITESVDTNKIYVSSSTGNDTTGNGTIGAPYATIAKGSVDLRNGYPDWLLLKRGDVFRDQSFGPDSNGFLVRNGRSATEPILLGSYGSTSLARPKLEVGASIGILRANYGNNTDYIAMVGIEARVYTRDPDDVAYVDISDAQGFLDINNLFNWLLVEDCLFQFFRGANINSGSSYQGTLIYRRVMTDRNWAGPSFGGTGILLGFVQNVSFQDCVWYQCAVAPNDAQAAWGLNGPPGAGLNNSHNLYLNYDAGIAEFKNCVSYLTQYHCLKARAGANITNSFLGKGTQGFELYNMDAAHHPTPGVPTATLNVFDNVFMNMRDADRSTVPTSGGGNSTGELANMNDSSAVGPIMFKRNICHHATGNATGSNLNLSTGSRFCEVTGNVIFSMPQGILNAGPHAADNVTTPNQIDLNGDNVEYSFPDPNNATLTAYATSIGLAANEDVLMRAICNNRNGAWDYRLTAPAINDYMRTKFGMATLGVDGSGGATATPTNRPRLRLR